MRYYKIVSDGCIVLIGSGMGGVEITAKKYMEIKAAIACAPVAPEGYSYRLTDALEWEIASDRPDGISEEKLE